MPSQYRFTRDFGHPVAEVFEAIVSPECWRERADSYGLGFEIVSRHRVDDAAELELRLRAGSTFLPRAMRAFTPGGTDIRCVDRWTRSAGGAVGHTELVMPEIPARQINETTVTATGPDSSRLRLYGEIQVAIPFAGRLVEHKVATHYHGVLASDCDVIQAWLERGRPVEPCG